MLFEANISTDSNFQGVKFLEEPRCKIKITKHDSEQAVLGESISVLWLHLESAREINQMTDMLTF